MPTALTRLAPAEMPFVLILILKGVTPPPGNMLFSGGAQPTSPLPSRRHHPLPPPHPKKKFFTNASVRKHLKKLFIGYHPFP